MLLSDFLNLTTPSKHRYIKSFTTKVQLISHIIHNILLLAHQQRGIVYSCN